MNTIEKIVKQIALECITIYCEKKVITMEEAKLLSASNVFYKWVVKEGTEESVIAIRQSALRSALMAIPVINPTPANSKEVLELAERFVQYINS